MTFTEAAEEILRAAGRPLHYKKITEIAIAQNLLSHVGKAPEITMSSRLATMVRNDRGDAPILKIKPGVFALREFSEEVLESARAESGHDYDAGDLDLSDHSERSTETVRETSEDVQPLPGADVFPEEEDDDEPILANLKEDEDSSRKRRRRPRKRRSEGSQGPREQSSRDRNGASQDTSEASPRRSESSGRQLEGEWSRELDDREGCGGELADAIAAALAQRAELSELSALAEELVKRGRLVGDATALVPTVAAAIASDTARRAGVGKRPRFRFVASAVALLDWVLPADALRHEEQVVAAAEKQRDAVRAHFVSQLSELPPVGQVQLLASWLNAEGVSGLRAVRRVDAKKGQFHLAGEQQQGPEVRHLAIVVFLDRKDITAEEVVAVRGAMHHYENATMAWVVTTGTIEQSATAEVKSEGSARVALFDGAALARAMERVGIGLVRHSVPLLSFDPALFEQLGSSTLGAAGGDADDAREGARRGRRRRRRGRGRRGAETTREEESTAESGENQDDSASASEAESGSESQAAKAPSPVDDEVAATGAPSESSNAGASSKVDDVTA